MRSRALEVARIALEDVSREDYSPQLKQHIYRNFFQSTRGGVVRDPVSTLRWQGYEAASISDSSESCAQKTWTWILDMTTTYVNAAMERLNDFATEAYQQVSPRLDAAGWIHNPNSFIAYPEDKSIKPLVAMMSMNPPLRNVLLKARYIWWQGYAGDWSQAPVLNSSGGKRPMIESLARELDSLFRANIIHNFVPRSIALVDSLLKQQALVPKGWPVDDQFRQWLFNMINTDADVRQALLSHYKHLPSDTAKSISRFIRSRRRRNRPNDLVELCNQLKRMATVPAGWPEHDSIEAYIFASVFRVPLHANGGIMPDQEALRTVPDGVKEHQGIQEVVQAYRGRMERLFGSVIIARGPKEAVTTEGFDLYDGLGYQRPSSDSPKSLQATKPRQAHRLLEATLDMEKILPDFSRDFINPVPATGLSPACILFSESQLSMLNRIDLVKEDYKAYRNATDGEEGKVKTAPRCRKKKGNVILIHCRLIRALSVLS